MTVYRLQEKCKTNFTFPLSHTSEETTVVRVVSDKAVAEPWAAEPQRKMQVARGPLHRDVFFSGGHRKRRGLRINQERTVSITLITPANSPEVVRMYTRLTTLNENFSGIGFIHLRLPRKRPFWARGQKTFISSNKMVMGGCPPAKG